MSLTDILSSLDAAASHVTQEKIKFVTTMFEDKGVRKIQVSMIVEANGRGDGKFLYAQGAGLDLETACAGLLQNFSQYLDEVDAKEKKIWEAAAGKYKRWTDSAAAARTVLGPLLPSPGQEPDPSAVP